MVDIHFIKDPQVLDVLQGILSLAGDNYNLPYDSDVQPADNAKRNTDDLLQYQLPGGGALQPVSDPSISESMGTTINSLLSGVSAFIAAYGLILPILGVIRGIIEIICALMNPWAVIRAVIRLFSKWIPPFLALFPPLAGIIMILNIIKVILSVVFFILTVVVPVIQLILVNINILLDSFGADGNKAKQDAGREKLIAILIEMINQLGVLKLLKPIVDVIFVILQLSAGFPCRSGDEDSTCCNDTVCPAVFKDMPAGRALVLPTYYADSLPRFAWKISTLTGNSRLDELIPYNQSFKEQLDAQLDEPVDEAKAAGGDDSAHFKIKLTGKRGGEQVSISPISKFSGKSITVIDPSIESLMGVVDYEIIPNWEVLIARNIIGVGCHPDVANAMDAMNNRFPDLDKSVIEKYPGIGDMQTGFNNMIDSFNILLDNLTDEVMDVVFDDKGDLTLYEAIPEVAIRDANQGPFDDNLNNINSIQDNMVTLLTDFADSLKDTMNDILSQVTDSSNSTLETDKTIVRSGVTDRAVVTVTPKDITNAFLLKNLPDDVSISVTLFTDFGTMSTQIIDSNLGTVTANLTSPIPGEAQVTAKINTDFITEFDISGETRKVINVQFVSDAVMPKRRFVSKQRTSSAKHSTTNSSFEREPGGSGG